VLISVNLAPVADLILPNHKKWKCTGYPLGLKGEKMPVKCRNFSIIDVFNAMISDRPYRKVKKNQEAIEELKNHPETQFDPQLMEIFIALA